MAVIAWWVAPGFRVQGQQLSTGNSPLDPAQPILATEAASRFVGSTGFEPVALEVDADGNIYVAGSYSTQSPSGSSLYDVELYKLNPQFQQVFRLQLEGSAWAGLNAMALDPSGNIYLAGTTTSTDFPLVDPVQDQMNGLQDAFLTKVDPDGNLLFSTYLGGSALETVDSLGVDADGNAVFGGHTTSTDFPTTSNAYISSFDSRELYLAKIDTGSASLTYATGFGATPNIDRFQGMVEVSGGDEFLLLGPSPNMLPTTDGSTNAGPQFGQLLARLSADGSELVYASYAVADAPLESLILDGNGNPVLAGPLQLVTIDPSTNMVTSSVRAQFLGNNVRLVGNGNFVGIGQGSVSSQATANGYPSGGNFVFEVNPNGVAEFVTYMPSGTVETDVAAGPNAELYLLGSSGMVSRILPGQADPLKAMPHILGIANAVGPRVTSGLAPGEIVSLYGISIGSQEAMTTQLGQDGLVTTELGGVEVHFNGTKGRLLYTGPTQVNAVAPFAWSQGDVVLVEIFHDGDLWSSILINPVDTEPGVFKYPQPRAASLAAALNQDQTVNTQANPAPAGSVVAIYLTGAGEMMGASYQDGEVFDPATPLADLPSPKLPVTVSTCCGRGAVTNPPPQEILYAGQAPASLAGVIQVNFRLPDAPPANADQVPLSLFLSVGPPPVPAFLGSVNFEIWMAPADGQ